MLCADLQCFANNINARPHTLARLPVYTYRLVPQPLSNQVLLQSNNTIIRYILLAC